MSRKIKFRAWCDEDNCYRIGCDLLLDLDGNFYNIHGEELYDSDGLTLEQCTGGYDKNGIEIYEGDILDTPGGRCKVVWADDGWCYQFKVHRTDWFDIVKDFHDKSEVIGNIHETPELCEEEE